MNTRQRTKGGTYSNITVQLQQFRLQNEVESSSFLSKCAEHVVWRRTVLVVALQQEKQEATNPSPFPDSSRLVGLGLISSRSERTAALHRSSQNNAFGTIAVQFWCILSYIRLLKQNKNFLGDGRLGGRGPRGPTPLNTPLIVPNCCSIDSMVLILYKSKFAVSHWLEMLPFALPRHLSVMKHLN